jgi:6-phosphogluconolactonase (cycloisomerase 2 family)
MKPPLRKTTAALVAGSAAAALAVTVVPAVANAATPRSKETISNAVFVQTNDKTGNQILAYSRSSAGSLAFVHAYNTGGKGAQEAGSVVDPLASQGSLYYDSSADLLIATNGGSKSVTSFHVNGDALSDAVVTSTGNLPTSVTSWGDYVYVLDAGGAGGVRGYTTAGSRLTPIPASDPSLGLNPKAAPRFLNTPGQIGVTPSGQQLIVTTKANGSTIDVWPIKSGGQLGALVKNISATPVPFSFVFGPHGRLVVTEAMDSDLSTYGLSADGTLTHLSSVSDHQMAACWSAKARDHYYVVNAGSADIASYEVSNSGQVTLVSKKAAVTGTGPIDIAASANGDYLYVEAGGTGAVDEMAVHSNGSLTSLGSITGLSGTGIEGIVAA